MRYFVACLFVLFAASLASAQTQMPTIAIMRMAGPTLSLSDGAHLRTLTGHIGLRHAQYSQWRPL
jgi:hypothetical protein